MYKYKQSHLIYVKKWLFLGGFLLIVGFGMLCLSIALYDIYNWLSWPIAAINSTTRELQIAGAIIMVLGLILLFLLWLTRGDNAENSCGR